MDAYEQKEQFVSVYLFENGQPFKPEKLRVKRCEIEKCFEKVGKNHCYKGKM